MPNLWKDAKWLISENSDLSRAGSIYHVPLHAELTDLLERHAARERMKPETIIAEAVRAYLGVDG